MQFSPTSEHLLLAYGRRHNTLLKSVVVDGETAVPIYTILEVKFESFLLLNKSVSYIYAMLRLSSLIFILSH